VDSLTLSAPAAGLLVLSITCLLIGAWKLTRLGWRAPGDCSCRTGAPKAPL